MVLGYIWDKILDFFKGVIWFPGNYIPGSLKISIRSSGYPSIASSSTPLSSSSLPVFLVSMYFYFLSNILVA